MRQKKSLKRDNKAKLIIRATENRNCAKLLQKLVSRIASEDRKAAMENFSISYVTVSRYLQGDVANLVLGLDLLNFFSQRISARKQQLDQLNSYPGKKKRKASFLNLQACGVVNGLEECGHLSPPQELL